MRSTPAQQSPLKLPSRAEVKARRFPVVRLPSPGDWVKDFPYGGFWQAEAYYESSATIRCAATLDEQFDEELVFEEQTYWVCECVEERPMTTDVIDALTSTYVILCTLHPIDQRLLRIGLWPQAWSGQGNAFSRVENEMLIIALAATGLVL
jgi:hypothetical protein